MRFLPEKQSSYSKSTCTNCSAWPARNVIKFFIHLIHLNFKPFFHIWSYCFFYIYFIWDHLVSHLWLIGLERDLFWMLRTQKFTNALAALQSIVCISLRHCVIWCTQARPKLRNSLCGAESSCTMPPLWVKRLCFSQAKTAFLMQQQQHNNNTTSGQRERKDCDPKNKTNGREEKSTKRRTYLLERRNFFSRSHADKITSIQLVLRAFLALTNATRYIDL